MLTPRELKERIDIRLKRVVKALNDPENSERIKARLLREEHAIYLFAMKGLEPYLKKDDSSGTQPAQIVGPQMD